MNKTIQRWLRRFVCFFPTKILSLFCVHGTVHLSNTDHINANEMQMFNILYLVSKALHVSDALCVHHQEDYKL